MIHSHYYSNTDMSSWLLQHLHQLTAFLCPPLLPIPHLCFSYSLIKQAEPVDETSVKKMILTFEKRSYKNQELRIKFPDNPEK